ncbi:hypothetical protein [Cellulosimicrobium cellulans]|uniref:Uncharacterized protein n=1 Tax=Cellulosimicrobium cellulans TaxID=1710 RepID=A0A4Y4E0L0_CELCE|nr:hypothetical protein [Cellulosimicrobium cellulans]GED09170.1 hypothetical protein CCE02nite_11690 [Cellulosimicrobium cellulans]
MTDYAPGVPVPVPDYGDVCHECGGTIDRWAPPSAVTCSDDCRTARRRRLARDRQARHRASSS